MCCQRRRHCCAAGEKPRVGSRTICSGLPAQCWPELCLSYGEVSSHIHSRLNKHGLGIERTSEMKVQLILTWRKKISSHFSEGLATRLAVFPMSLCCQKLCGHLMSYLTLMSTSKPHFKLGKCYASVGRLGSTPTSSLFPFTPPFLLSIPPGLSSLLCALLFPTFVSPS